MKPRVLIMVDTYRIGGSGKVILQFLTTGSGEMLDSIIAGFWRGPDRKWQFKEAVDNIGVPFEVIQQAFAYDAKCIFRVWQIVRQNNIQVLQSHGYKAHIVCLVLSKLTGLPWMAFIHGWTDENFKINLYNYTEKLVVRFADRIIPVSQELKNRLGLGRRALKRTIVITNSADWVDTTKEFPNKRLELGIKDDDILVAVIGRFSPEKGVRYFVKAMELLAHDCPQVKAVLVGDGVEHQQIENDIKRLGLERTVYLIGYQEDVSPYYHASDIVCIPSLSEGMPNVALEAMMFAKPLVATRVGGVPEVVVDGETGFLVASCDPGGLAQALKVLVTDENRRIMMGKKGKKRVEDIFDPTQRTQKICDLIRELILSRRNRKI
jgi:glycosyltransferase involved in cell wall biosynthesis